MTDDEIIKALKDTPDYAEFGFKISTCPRCGHPTIDAFGYICPTCKYEDGYDDLPEEEI